MIQLPPDTYGQAILHATWFGDNATQTYHLLFAMVELRPTELPVTTGSPMHTCQYGRAKQYAFYQRLPMSVDDALRCYDRALHNRPSLPPTPRAIRMKPRSRVALLFGSRTNRRSSRRGIYLLRPTGCEIVGSTSCSRTNRSPMTYGKLLRALRLARSSMTGSTST